jgi:ketosteroid isomerase-like protein
MSQENVELVKAVCTPWERGDFSSVEWAHPEIEFAFADGPTPGTWSGRGAMSDAWRETLSAFEDLDVKVEDYIPLAGDRVLVLMHNTGHGKASGFDLGQLAPNRGANLFHIREGRVTKLVLYFDRERALEAVGLSE